MKKINLCLIYILISVSAFAQNPFKKYCDIPTISVKDSKKEFHLNKNIIEVGDILFDIKTNKIVSFINSPEEEPGTRFLTMDPLAEKYYSISPYVYCANNPIKYIDPDGMKIEGVKYDEDKDEFRYSKRAMKNGTDQVINAAASTDGGKSDVLTLINDKKTYGVIQVEGPMYLYDKDTKTSTQAEAYLDQSATTIYISTELKKNESTEGKVTLIKEFRGESGYTSSMKQVELSSLTLSKPNAEYVNSLSESGASTYNKQNPYKTIKEAVHGRFSHEYGHTQTGPSEVKAMGHEVKRRTEYNKKYPK